MAIYVKNNNDFEQSEPIVRECPHCGVHAPLIPIATPAFDALASSRPRHAGVAFRCAACNEPRFARVAIRSFGDDRIVLSANLVEIERSKERFQYNYLPDRIQRLLREAFGCYTAELYLAFGILCRRTIEIAARDGTTGDIGEFAKLFDDTVALGDVDAATSGVLRDALFGQGPDPELNEDQAAVLIEIVKEMFQQRYVRTAKLRRAIRMRRFFAGERDQDPAPLESLATRSRTLEH